MDILKSCRILNHLIKLEFSKTKLTNIPIKLTIILDNLSNKLLTYINKY